MVDHSLKVSRFITISMRSLYSFGQICCTIVSWPSKPLTECNRIRSYHVLNEISNVEDFHKSMVVVSGNFTYSTVFRNISVTRYPYDVNYALPNDFNKISAAV